MEEDGIFELTSEPKHCCYSFCQCLEHDESSKEVEIPARKKKVLTTVARTEHYLRERRIPELIRFLITKVTVEGSVRPVAYLEKLLNDCMLFRAGYGAAPVLFEQKHLEAVVKSFDPGQRGWLSAGQIRRAYLTLGLTPDENMEDTMSTEAVLKSLEKAQKTELLQLLSAGITRQHDSSESLDVLWD